MPGGHGGCAVVCLCCAAAALQSTASSRGSHLGHVEATSLWLYIPVFQNSRVSRLRDWMVT